MPDEEQTTNAESFATLSEASFAEDWGSKEDRAYDEPEAKLAALLAANGPLPNEHYHALAAVALRLARALRRWSEIVEDTVNCGSCTDSACEAHLMQYENALTEAAKALAEWDRVLKRLGDG